MPLTKLLSRIGAALAEMAGLWIAVGIFSVVAILAFMNPPSRGIGIVYVVLAAGSIVFSVFRTRTEIEKMRL